MIQHKTIFQVQQLQQEEIWLAEMADTTAKGSFSAQKSEKLESRNPDELKPFQEETPAQTNEVTYSKPTKLNVTTFIRPKERGACRA